MIQSLGECFCKFGSCNVTTGGCDCLMGFTGINCQFPCETGFYGHQCNNICYCPIEKCDNQYGCSFDSLPYQHDENTANMIGPAFILSTMIFTIMIIFIILHQIQKYEKMIYQRDENHNRQQNIPSTIVTINKPTPTTPKTIKIQFIGTQKNQQQHQPNQLNSRENNQEGSLLQPSKEDEGSLIAIKEKD